MKFRMVDRIIDWRRDQRITGTKTVSFEEYRLKSAFDNQPCLPESLVLESFFQLGNWLIVLSSDFTQMGLVLRTGQISFDSPLLPGECMVMEITAHSYRPDGVLFSGQGRVGRRLVARGESCLATPVGLADYASAADLRMLFSEIYQPRREGTP